MLSSLVTWTFKKAGYAYAVINLFDDSNVTARNIYIESKQV
jgi:hypothetical protein